MKSSLIDNNTNIINNINNKSNLTFTNKEKCNLIKASNDNRDGEINILNKTDNNAFNSPKLRLNNVLRVIILFTMGSVLAFVLNVTYNFEIIIFRFINCLFIYRFFKWNINQIYFQVMCGSFYKQPGGLYHFVVLQLVS
jgi:hypothetical protein